MARATSKVLLFISWSYLFVDSGCWGYAIEDSSHPVSRNGTYVRPSGPCPIADPIVPFRRPTFRLLYFVGHFYAVMRNGNGNGIRRYIALGVMCTCAYRGGCADIIARYPGQAKQRFNGT